MKLKTILTVFAFKFRWTTEIDVPAVNDIAQSLTKKCPEQA
jgi:hypothetical protein